MLVTIVKWHALLSMKQTLSQKGRFGGPSSSDVGTKTQKTETDWSSGLYSCLDDAGICESPSSPRLVFHLHFQVSGADAVHPVYSARTPVLYTRQRRSLVLSSWLVVCTFPVFPSTAVSRVRISIVLTIELGIGGLVRSDLRRKYGLKHEPCGDCIVHLFCFPCALCQEARELKVPSHFYIQIFA